MDRGAGGPQRQAGRLRRGVVHLQAVTQGKEGKMVHQEPGKAS